MGKQFTIGQRVRVKIHMEREPGLKWLDGEEGEVTFDRVEMTHQKGKQVHVKFDNPKGVERLKGASWVSEDILKKI
jgi:hypothetical protein